MPARQPLLETLRRGLLSTLAAAAIGMATIPVPGASAEEAGVERGRALLEANCARCHAIDAVGDSPFPLAPPFRTLHARYAVENLEEALAEGILSGHPAMPEFTFEPAQIADIIAYLRSIQSE